MYFFLRCARWKGFVQTLVPVIICGFISLFQPPPTFSTPSDFALLIEPGLHAHTDNNILNLPSWLFSSSGDPGSLSLML